MVDLRMQGVIARLSMYLYRQCGRFTSPSFPLSWTAYALRRTRLPPHLGFCHRHSTFQRLKVRFLARLDIGYLFRPTNLHSTHRFN
jgi:hypothetical protein